VVWFDLIFLKLFIHDRNRDCVPFAACRKIFTGKTGFAQTNRFYLIWPKAVIRIRMEGRLL